MKGLEYYYWVGFIAADGNFRHLKTRTTIKVALAKKDESHLELMKNYFGEENCWGVNYYRTYSQLIYHKKNEITNIQIEFDLKERKTYNPPDVKIFDAMTDEQFLSFLSGYADGDGSVQFQSGRKDCVLSFRVHASWITVLLKMNIRLEHICGCSIPIPKVMNDGYARWVISNCKVLRQLKLWILKGKHPYLHRKWDKINENKMSKYEWQSFYTPRVIELRNKGYTFEKIGAKLGIKTTTAFNYFNRKNGSHSKI